MRLSGPDGILVAKQVAQLTSAGCKCTSLPAGGCLLYQVDVPYCFIFLSWQISFHRGPAGNVLLDIAFKEHPAFNPLAASEQPLLKLLDPWILSQERQLHQVLEQVFLRHAFSLMKLALCTQDQQVLAAVKSQGYGPTHDVLA